MTQSELHNLHCCSASAIPHHANETAFMARFNAMNALPYSVAAITPGPAGCDQQAPTSITQDRTVLDARHRRASHSMHSISRTNFEEKFRIYAMQGEIFSALGHTIHDAQHFKESQESAREHFMCSKPVYQESTNAIFDFHSQPLGTPCGKDFETRAQIEHDHSDPKDVMGDAWPWVNQRARANSSPDFLSLPPSPAAPDEPSDSCDNPTTPRPPKGCQPQGNLTRTHSCALRPLVHTKDGHSHRKRVAEMTAEELARVRASSREAAKRSRATAWKRREELKKRLDTLNRQSVVLRAEVNRWRKQAEELLVLVHRSGFW